MEAGDEQKDPLLVFELISKLGEGSYGSVVKARHRKNGAFFAIKCGGAQETRHGASRRRRTQKHSGRGERRRARRADRLVPIEENETLAELMREVDVMRALQSPYILRQYCTYVRDNLLWVRRSGRETGAWIWRGERDGGGRGLTLSSAVANGRRCALAQQIVLEYCPGGSVSDYMRVCKRTFGEAHIASVARYATEPVSRSRQWAGG